MILEKAKQDRIVRALKLYLETIPTGYNRAYDSERGFCEDTIYTMEHNKWETVR